MDDSVSDFQLTFWLLTSGDSYLAGWSGVRGGWWGHLQLQGFAFICRSQEYSMTQGVTGKLCIFISI